MSRRQHHKGKARPRAWHHGRRQGRVNDSALQRVEPAYAEAEADRDRSDSVRDRTRAEIADWGALVSGLEHVAPHVLELPALG